MQKGWYVVDKQEFKRQSDRKSTIVRGPGENKRTIHKGNDVCDTEKRQKWYRLTRCQAKHQGTIGEGSEASGMSIVPVCEPQPYKEREHTRLAQAGTAEVQKLGKSSLKDIKIKVEGQR